MRIVLVTALIALAGCAAAPSAPEPAAPAAQAAAPAPAPAEQLAATETAAAAIAAEAEEKEFRPPPGYKLKRERGVEIYCTKMTVLGSRFPKEDCRTEAQLRDLERQKESMRGEMDQKGKICSSAAGCANN
jgi:pyruvate/2-oxoglutarate dehydrogenase complex dihydrolipoamide acyltransferase (E2) component